MQSGHLEGPLLFIETLTPESKAFVNDFALDFWLSRTPAMTWSPVQENTQPLLQDWPVQENGLDEHSARLQTPAPGGNLDLQGLPPVETLTEAEFEVQENGLAEHSDRLQTLALEGDFDQGLPPGETLAEAEFQAELNTFINTHASEETRITASTPPVKAGKQQTFRLGVTAL
ncbi:hypothetical protein CEP51_002334 [Fusarium floridanum]|uniref:Uncharacterized protein n=1 Tax=Fusarium floridanum TaxID=1325733 RepID=A0A428SBN2_9HYPO|nr:hypothetical protein CEP51_002334 [Fusarium floridanum]